MAKAKKYLCHSKDKLTAAQIELIWEYRLEYNELRYKPIPLEKMLPPLISDYNIIQKLGNGCPKEAARVHAKAIRGLNDYVYSGGYDGDMEH